MNIEKLFIKKIAERYYSKNVENHADFLIEVLQEVIDKHKEEYNEFQMGLFMSRYIKLIDLLKEDPYQVLFIDIEDYKEIHEKDMFSHLDFIDQLIESMVRFLATS